jgi:hypothetical protein
MNLKELIQQALVENGESTESELNRDVRYYDVASVREALEALQKEGKVAVRTINGRRYWDAIPFDGPTGTFTPLKSKDQ